MAEVDRTSQAEADLTDIFLYIAEDNLPAAEKLLRSVGEKCDLLAGTPGMGRERPELGNGVHSFPVGNHTIFYKPTLTGIVLLRVLHGARDISAFY
ncbi:MAG: type II toxin-antitoxin system RelE/ParE family toxin [Rhodospirillales bacterium]|jgi:toxin ParE1/3/4